MTYKEYTELTNEEKQRLFLDFHLKMKSKNYLCSDMCPLYDRLEEDCVVFGDDRLSFSVCPYSFFKWLFEQKPKTNLGRIGQMSDQQLAREMSNHRMCECCIYLNNGCDSPEANCFIGIRKWLNSEIKK